MADISKIILPNGSEYNIKDTTARTTANSKQDALVSGTNIKTINNTSILGSGNIDISGGGGTSSAMKRTGASSGTLTLGNGSANIKKIELIQTDFTEGNGFSADTTNKGIKCNEAGVVFVTAKIRVYDSFTANDYVNAYIYKGNSSIAMGRIRTSFQTYNSDIVISTYATVSANDVLTLWAYNDTGSRGTILKSATNMSVGYIKAGSSGGASFNPSGVESIIDAFSQEGAGWDYMPDDYKAPFQNILEGSYTSLDDYMEAYAQMICDIWDFMAFNLQ